MIYWNIFLIFLRKQVLTFHAICLKCAWNVKSCFLGIRKYHQFVNCRISPESGKGKLSFNWIIFFLISCFHLLMEDQFGMYQCCVLCTWAKICFVFSENRFWHFIDYLLTVGKIFGRQHIEIFLLFFPENRIWRQFAWNIKACFGG